MKYDITVDAGGRYCEVCLHGRLDLSEYETAMTAFIEHPGVVPGMPTVYDLRDAQLGHLNADAFRVMSATNAQLAARRGRARVAMVVGDPVHFGLARMYQVLGASPNLETQVFTDYAKALQWAQESSVAG